MEGKYRKEKGTSEWMDEWMTEWINEVFDVYVYMNKCKCISEGGRKIDNWMNEKMDQWKNEWKDEWVNHWLFYVKLKV